MEYKSPVSCQLEITYKCNNLCEYCYNYWRWDEKNQEEMSLEDFKTIVDKLAENDVWYVNLTGGEPLVEKERTLEILKYGTGKGLVLTMNSNLVEADDRELVKRIKYSGCKGILGSITTYDEEEHNRITNNENSFQQTVKGMENIVDEDLGLSVDMAVYKRNWKDVYETGRFLADLGVERFCTSRFIPSFANPKHLDLALSAEEMKSVVHQQIEAHEDFGIDVKAILPIPYCIFDEDDVVFQYKGMLRSCAAGRSTISISPSGKVRPCIHLGIEEGDLLREDLSEIWPRMKKWRENKFVPEECEGCDTFQYCMGGCRAEPYARTGDLGGKDVLFNEQRSPPDFDFEGNPPLKGNDKLFVKNFKKRNESFGAVVSNSLSQTYPVNEDGLLILETLKNNRGIELRELISGLDEEKQEKIIQYVDYLYQGGIIDAN